MANFTLTETETGPLTLQTGDSLTFDLAENGTTGYRWEIDAPPELVPVSDDLFSADRPDRAGAAGRRVIQYEARQPGDLRVEARLRRPWEAESAALQTLVFSLRVTPAR